MDTVAVAHLTAAAAYAGFQWTVRVLVYPQLAAVGAASPAGFAAYEATHQHRVSRVVGPLFAGLVLSTGAVLATRPASGPARLSAAATAAVLAVTAFGAVPEHGRLGRGFDGAAYRRLRRWDDVRVAAATVQVGCAVLLLR